MSITSKLKSMKHRSLISAALAEIQKEQVKEATAKLKELYAQEKKLMKALRNVRREIEDYLLELELDDEEETNGGKTDE